MFLIFRSLDFFPIFRLNSCGWHAFFKMEYWMQLGLALHWLHLQQYTTMINLVIRALFFFFFVNNTEEKLTWRTQWLCADKVAFLLTIGVVPSHPELQTMLIASMIAWRPLCPRCEFLVFEKTAIGPLPNTLLLSI